MRHRRLKYSISLANTAPLFMFGFVGVAHHLFQVACGREGTLIWFSLRQPHSIVSSAMSSFSGFRKTVTSLTRNSGRSSTSSSYRDKNEPDMPYRSRT
jgi:hypothetical protein